MAAVQENVWCRLKSPLSQRKLLFSGWCLDSSHISASVAADVLSLQAGSGLIVSHAASWKQVLGMFSLLGTVCSTWKGLFLQRRCSSGETCVLTDLKHPPSDWTFLQLHYCCFSDFIRFLSRPDIICGMTIITWSHGLDIKDSTSINHMEPNFKY